VPIEQASSFGVIVTDSERRIIGFEEKPKSPTPMPDNPSRAYVSMGNYIFSREILLDALAKTQRKRHYDFGAHVIPGLVPSRKVFAYDFATNIIPGTMPYEEEGYWRDVGSIASFFDAHMDMLGSAPLFELDNKLWPIHPSGYIGPAAKILKGDITNSLISEGTVIHGAAIRNSVIRCGVTIEEGVSVEDCIVLDHSVLKRGCRLRRVIVDKLNVVQEKEVIGYNPERDRFRCHIDPSGIAILPRGGRPLKISE
ncbi:MAG TPA: sugar phosphate nucleotidyltransferase, partial [Thermodesulfovibrionales bacterium]|nr:sugar phosphate nucleotidyltransferase [Thermodesulfovibrionales bacterium]